MNRFEELKNLLIIAAADGSFTSDEINMLSLRAYRWGLTDDQFEEALDYAMSGDAVIAIPPAKEDCLELLKEMVLVMAADGQLDEAEMLVFARAAAKMRISDEELNQTIDSLL